MARVFELASLIHGKYDSESDFADQLGWPRQRLNKIVNGDQKPTLDDVEQISRGLDAPFMTVANIFLRSGSTNGQQGDGENACRSS